MLLKKLKLWKVIAYFYQVKKKLGFCLVGTGKLKRGKTVKIFELKGGLGGVSVEKRESDRF